MTCKGGRKLKTHMDSHREVNCKHCDKRIPYNSRNSHTIKCVGEKKAFKCENCPATFNKADNLKVHMANKRCSVQCNLCEKTLQSEFYLEKHISSTHRVQMNLVKTAEGHIGFFPSNELRNDLHCTHCDFFATSSSKLKRHMIKHNHICDQCNYACTLFGALRRHNDITLEKSQRLVAINW